MKAYKFKNHEGKILMPVILFGLWVANIFFVTAAFNAYIDYSNNKNSRLVDFEFNNKELLLLRKKYPVIRDGRESYHESYLYGRIMVDLKDIKILCSVKEENGSRFCHRFSGSDLQRMDWITDEAPKQAEQPAQIPIIRKLLRFLSSCKG